MITRILKVRGSRWNEARHTPWMFCVPLSRIHFWLWISHWSHWHIWSSLQWCHNEHDSVSNHQPHDCLLNRLFRRRSKKTSKLRVTGLCVGNSPGTGEFPAQMASNAENVSIWWRHHVVSFGCTSGMNMRILNNYKQLIRLKKCDVSCLPLKQTT